MNALNTRAAAGLAAAALLFANPAQARADLTDDAAGYVELKGTAICTVLGTADDDGLTNNDVHRIARFIVSDGYTTKQAGNIMVASVNQYCPKLRMPLWKAVQTDS